MFIVGFEGYQDVTKNAIRLARGRLNIIIVLLEPIADECSFDDMIRHCETLGEIDAQIKEASGGRYSRTLIARVFELPEDFTRIIMRCLEKSASRYVPEGRPRRRKLSLRSIPTSEEVLNMSVVSARVLFKLPKWFFGCISRLKRRCNSFSHSRRFNIFLMCSSSCVANQNESCGPVDVFLFKSETMRLSIRSYLDCACCAAI
ncbi:hypothetical protein BKA63DRAFT_194811 [Paraphoma chrysanthemicola]|nr:hypothetical protein BKA63DRAFT_194811 [Paraphoma chrysanthemicola]